MRTVIAPRRQQGFMAIVLVVFLVVLMVIAAGIVSMSTSGARGAADHANAARALFKAESGIEWAARELFDTDEPAVDCPALQGATRTINGAGSFTLTEATLLEDPVACQVSSRGAVGPTRRVLTGVIPRAILDGEGGGDNLFDDEDAWFGGGGNVSVDEGVMTILRPGTGVGNTNTRARATDVIGTPFEDGEMVYFTANLSWDDDPTGNRFGIEVRNNIAECSVVFPDLLGGNCSAPAGHPLYDQFNLVFMLGDGFASEDINRIDLDIDWAGNDSSLAVLENGCLGREATCGGQGTDDPTEGGGWNENP